MVEVFRSGTTLHFSPKNLGLNDGFLGLFSNSLGLFSGCPELKFRGYFRKVRS